MCSKKVAGIALVVTGATLIVIGIIVGVLLPNVAQKATEGQTCVNNEDSPGYKRWVSIVSNQLDQDRSIWFVIIQYNSGKL